MAEMGFKMGLIWFQVLYSLYYTVYCLPKQTSEDKKKNDKMCFPKPVGLQLGMGKRHRQTERLTQDVWDQMSH